MFKWPMQFFRLFYINYVLVKHGVHRVVLSARFFHPWRFISPFYWFRDKSKTRGESIRLALETLGPIFVKFGQILSTRRDFIPDDIADELELLVDQVPPFPGIDAQKRLEQAYGQPLSEVFAEFDIEPLASASIAQVHRAKLPDGQQVAVKVMRPNIRRIISRDVGLMYLVARLVQRFWSEGHRLRPIEVVAEFEKTIIDELDMMREAANASQLRRNFTNSPILYVPEVYWEYTRTQVLVTELLTGVPITNIALLKKQQINFKKLAENGVEIFFTQVFRDSFFHADMHCGNIFVSLANKENPKYMAVDFGIMGSLSPADQRYLAENLLAFFKRDYRQVALLHVESGWVPPGTRIEEFESAIRSVCEPIFGKPLSEISFGRLLLRLFQTASRFDMEVQPQLLLLQKTLINIEGLGRQLYPDLDLWATAKPFLEKWMKSRVSPKALLSAAAEKAPFWAEKFNDVPDLMYKLLQAKSEAKPPVAPVSEPEKKAPRSLQMGLLLLVLGGVQYLIQAEPVETRQLFDVLFVGMGAILTIWGLRKI